MYDPVCGMEILPERAAATARYEGQTYYFCAPTCYERFLARPEFYRDALQPTTYYARQLYEALETLHGVFYQPPTPPEDALTEAERAALTILGRRGEQPMRQLASLCQVALSTMTGIIDRLLERGLVQRQQSPADRRVVLVQLTNAGRRVYQARLDTDMRLVLTMLQALAAEEQQILVTCLQKILASLPLEDSQSHPSLADHRSSPHANPAT